MEPFYKSLSFISTAALQSLYHAPCAGCLELASCIGSMPAALLGRCWVLHQCAHAGALRLLPVFGALNHYRRE
jgi:hypothetical protein